MPARLKEGYELSPQNGPRATACQGGLSHSIYFGHAAANRLLLRQPFDRNSRSSFRRIAGRRPRLFTYYKGRTIATADHINVLLVVVPGAPLAMPRSSRDGTCNVGPPTTLNTGWRLGGGRAGAYGFRMKSASSSVGPFGR